MAARRTLLLANREPFSGRTDKRGRPQLTVGGLVSALAPLLTAQPGAWIAARTEGAGGDGVVKVPLAGDGADPYTVRYVGVPDRDYSSYYNGVANNALWPLFHSFIDRTQFDARQWEAYERVNKRFAEVALTEAEPGDWVWVHDYHLMLVPRLLREARPDLTIGFFLHIPFPGVEIFRTFPRWRPILEGVLGADLAGFHVPRYAVDFAVAAKRLLGAKVTREFSRVDYGGRRIRVGAFPIGIDAHAMAEEAADRATAVRRMRRQLEAEQMILGVDRMDYTKGILERLEAIELFLDRHPEWRGRVVFVQICVPSRTRVPAYQEMKRDIEEAVGRINGRFGEAGWMPIRYLYRSFPRKELLGYYRAADVCLVTPRRDGMNLVAKEYIASQGEEGGVLVLSELTGAASELSDAVPVNPYDVDGMAEAIHTALMLEPGERQTRMAALKRKVFDHSGTWWREQFLSALAEAVAERKSRSPSDSETRTEASH